MPFDLDDPTTIPLIRIEVGGHLGFGVFALARDHPHPVAPALADPEVPGPIPSAENPTPAPPQASTQTSSGGLPSTTSWHLEHHKRVKVLADSQTFALETLKATTRGIAQEKLDEHFDQAQFDFRHVLSHSPLSTITLISSYWANFYRKWDSARPGDLEELSVKIRARIKVRIIFCYRLLNWRPTVTCRCSRRVVRARRTIILGGHGRVAWSSSSFSLPSLPSI